MMYPNLILHIPHASTYIPNWDEFHDREEVAQSIDCLTDHFVDKLFSNSMENVEMIKFGFSRIYCDVERYFDNSKEFMFERGMGYCYTHGVNLKTIRDVDLINLAEVNKVYWEHHANLYHSVKRLNDNNIKPLLIDCHSFSNETYICDQDFKKGILPDFCLGFNDEEGEEICLIMKEILEFRNYSVALNYPYSGSLVVNNTIHDSVMIEINKRIYLNKGLTLQTDYYKIHSALIAILEKLSSVASY
ncbi:N-formylglutamate amidohydrolase [Parabacteroides sp. PF5-5]|uniref:N-formylglutamate amidohydrolase n=1 Tax=unclassified Parabacteroides TaxID=2649774 RepID=UPI0024772227|nr:MULTISPECIES: N-formylglutamate amidohydrolase [unclassified Parabacteroides]MDH6304843.1 N-formylglutamate amidohydrolase [Parabacteroides sp. PH5-39]MDH6316071.1 N-formylglutamate amidohydrolase [Parabacteroides sp. PF5-13]MDH6319728.1 N-formylglutamate amidohydrolase [Parabacteroides sp. PH5-13]MDH6323459.1 N-formylglutamate amidohydrolase [Parabacteroides sp. PH5-8]MDH6327033.1 N-formylglutamate amidohydrolase [Parabacteroides sp. PH5-41]